MRVLISAILLLSTVFANAVNLDGFWQFGSDLEANEWGRGYQFDGDKFIYFRGSFDVVLNPVSTVGGHFRIENDSIYFKAEYFKIYNFNFVEFEEWPRSWIWYTSRNGNDYDVDIYRNYRYTHPEEFSEKIQIEDKDVIIGGEKFYRLQSTLWPTLPENDLNWPIFNGISEKYKTGAAKPSVSVQKAGRFDGFWEEDTSDNWLFGENYVFKGDRFMRLKGERDVFDPIESFGGHYRIEGDTIAFRVEFIQMADMDVIHLNCKEGLSDQWDVSGKSKKKVNLRFRKPYWTKAEIKRTGNQLEINSRKFIFSNDENDLEIPGNYNEWPIFDSFGKLLDPPFLP